MPNWFSTPGSSFILRSRRVRSYRRELIALGAFLLLILTLCSCGGGGDEGQTVATVGDTKISQPTIDHWMGVVLGGDYTATLNERAPDGLVSDPPRYERCVTAAQAIVPKVKGIPKLTISQVRVKCRQLNAAIREQALAYVLSVIWSKEEGVEMGLRVPDEAEISRHLHEFVYAQFKSPANFQKVIAKQHRSLADVRFLVKRNILETQIMARLTARAHKHGGGQRAVYKLVFMNNAKWKARTSCRPGYRAWECKQAGSSAEAMPPAAVVLEDLARGVA